MSSSESKPSPLNTPATPSGLEGSVTSSNLPNTNADVEELPPVISVSIEQSDIVTKPVEYVPPPYKETMAGRVAMRLLLIFGLALGAAFLIILALIVPLWWHWNTEEVATKVLPAMSGILETIKIIGTIFSPLLAFILGYYFTLSVSNDVNENTPNEPQSNKRK